MSNLLSRIGLTFSNIAILIPIFILVFVAAILSSITAAKVGGVQDKTAAINKALGLTIIQTVMLWVLSVGSLLFAFTIGIFVIPVVAQTPYVFGGLLIMLAIVNLIMAGSFFYTAVAVGGSADYKAADANAKSAFNYSLIIGLIMLISAIVIALYAIWVIYKYYQYGGITQDIKLAVKLGTAVAAPEVGATELLGGLVSTSDGGKDVGISEQMLPQLATAFGAKSGDVETIQKMLTLKQQLGGGT